uniref:Hydrophobic seed protein domain-containing protein n=1 Tax=Zea mays TaxID=4577 RepID=B6T0Q6_MAIZE|nr:hypothetical protein [Zea mays]
MAAAALREQLNALLSSMFASGLVDGLADLEAAVCLCTALKANVLGINLDVPVKLTLLLNYCGKSVPQGFLCA